MPAVGSAGAVTVLARLHALGLARHLRVLRRVGEVALAEVGDLFAPLGPDRSGLPDDGFSIRSLLDLADQDERDHGLGDLPYPPEYPKMPGEPKRVQPSRDRDRPAASDTDADADGTT